MAASQGGSAISGVAASAPSPATVWIRSEVLFTCRTLLSSSSAIYRCPAGSIPRLLGPFNLARVAGTPSPVNPMTTWFRRRL